MGHDKSGLGRYLGRCGKAASCAILNLLSTAGCKGIFQDQDMLVCQVGVERLPSGVGQTLPHLPYRDPLLDLLCMVKKRIHVLIKYLFDFVIPGSSARLMAANKHLFTQLYPNTFHCCNLETDADQFKHPSFVKAICEDSFAVWNHKDFDIMPLPAMAFVLTMTVSVSGRLGLSGLRKTLAPVPEVSCSQAARFPTEVVQEGNEICWIHKPSDDKMFSQPVTQACNVQPNTPKQSEPEYDGNGRLTAQAKGKGKAQPPSDDSESGDDSDE
ncbi:hypothetical protein FRC10_004567 [Ceratobasidium sp. 414]|nr:hypothetical protein FRC10_004567 [Ceratobasidium sp. 414]